MQCALIAKRYSYFLKQFYRRIQRRHGGGKANIALVPAFLGVIYHALEITGCSRAFPISSWPSGNRHTLQHE